MKTLEKATAWIVLLELILGGVVVTDKGKSVESVSQATVTMDEMRSRDEEGENSEVPRVVPWMSVPGGLPVPEEHSVPQKGRAYEQGTDSKKSGNFGCSGGVDTGRNNSGR